MILHKLNHNIKIILSLILRSRKDLSFIAFLCIFLWLFYSPNVAAKDLTIGMSAAFKGPTGGLGTELYRGSMAYLNYINESGGIHGKKISINAYDDGYNPVPAIENTIKLIEKDNVFLLFNYVGTPTVTRVLPILKNYSDKSVYLFFLLRARSPTDKRRMMHLFSILGHLTIRRQRVSLTIWWVSDGRESLFSIRLMPMGGADGTG